MIVQTITSSFKAEILQGVQDILTDTLKMAIYTANANLNAFTTVYTSANEVVSANYSAGGNVCTGVTITTDTQSGIVYVNFSNVVWTNVSFTCRGALIYNVSKANRSVACLNFGSDKSAGPNFTVTLPANTPTTALIRL